MNLHKYYIYSFIIGIFTSFLFFIISILIPNFRFLTTLRSYSTMDLWSFLNIIKLVLISWYSINDITARLFLTIGVLLAGIQGGLSMYLYLKQRSVLASAKGNAWTLLSALGAGCVSCGSFILAGLLGLGTSNVILSYLPFEGLEVGLVGIAILLITIFFTIKKIRKPFVC